MSTERVLLRPEDIRVDGSEYELDSNAAGPARESPVDAAADADEIRLALGVLARARAMLDCVSRHEPTGPIDYAPVSLHGHIRTAYWDAVALLLEEDAAKRATMPGAEWLRDEGAAT